VKKPDCDAHPAVALAGCAGDRRRAAFGAGSLAGVTGNGSGNADVGLFSPEGVFQGNFHVVAQVASLPGVAARSLGMHEVAEHFVENIGESGSKTALPPRSARPALLKSRMAVTVEGGALFVVAQHFVSFGDVLELLFRGLVAGVAVGVIFHRQLAIGALDVGAAGVPADA